MEGTMGFEPKKRFKARGLMALSLMGLLLGAGMMAISVNASITLVHVPGSSRIQVFATITSFTYIGNDGLQLRIQLKIMNTLPNAPESTTTLSGRVVAFSANPATDPTAIQYAKTSFHNITVAGGQTVYVDRLAIVRPVRKAASDMHAFLAASVVALRDGVTYTYYNEADVDTACFITALANPYTGCRVTITR